MPTKKINLFISYTADNLSIARVVAELAKAAGLSVWFDRWSLTPGEDWALALRAAIADASMAAILVGNHADSPYFLAEIEALTKRAATEGSPHVLAVLLPDAGDNIPELLNGVSVIDLRGTEGIAEHLATGIETIRHAVGPLFGRVIDNPALVATLYATIGKRLYALKRRHEAMQLFDKAVSKIADAVADKPTTQTGGILAGLLKQIGQLFQQHKPIHHDVASPPFQQLIALLGNWASEMHDQGDYEGARLALQGLMKALVEASGDSDDPAALTLANNLALSFRAKGRLVDAQELDTHVLSMRRARLGDEHPDTLSSMSNLAATLMAQGDLASALELQKSALAIRRRVLGEEHPDTLTSMNNLASTLQAQGDLSSALELQKSVLTIQRRVLGEEHPAILSSMNNLASTLYAQGDLAGALELQKSVLRIQRRVLGEEHPDTLTSMNNLAGTLYAQGDLAGALELEKSALAIRHRVLGDEHPDTLTSMNNLASTLQAQGDLVGALELQRSVLTKQRRMLGEEHPDTLTSMNNLASTLKAQGDLADALELQKSVLAIQRRVLGEEHPDTLISAWNLFMTALQLEDHATVQEIFKTHLLPLLKRDPAALGANLTNIRNQLIKLLPPDQEAP